MVRGWRGAYLNEEEIDRCGKEVIRNVDDLSAEGYARQL